MLYQLEFKYDSFYDVTIINNAKSLDFFYTQELNWTNGHFILESIKEGLIITLLAYPHIEPPVQELIIIQEYILDKLNINQQSINLLKFISKSDDDTHITPYQTNSLLIKSLSQDYFFNKILELSIRENSNYIAAVFYKYYFYDGIINRYKTLNFIYNIEYNKKSEYIHQKISFFYKREVASGLPIFIINAQSKNEFQLIRHCIIEEIKKISNFELQKCIYTPINVDSLFKFINNIHTHSFSNNILGQVWDISFDFDLSFYSSSESILQDSLKLKLNNSKYQTLIIILNQFRTPLSNLLFKEDLIIL